MAIKDPRGGPINRAKRYPVRHLVRISEDADATLLEMSKVKGAPLATLLRRSVMKDIYIYKNEKKKREALEKKITEDID